MKARGVAAGTPAQADLFASAWERHRGYVLNIAYRLVGSFSEAEDLVQEAYTRMLRIDQSTIDDVRGWLVTVVTRLCMDHLRSARVRRETAAGPWLPEPLVLSGETGADPAEVVTFDESVRMALLIVLERLTPAERATFILHDVFEFTFEEIAPILERAPEACRQLASRARRRVHAEAGAARNAIAEDQLQRVAQAFMNATAKGEVHALVEVLDPAVVGWADVGSLAGRFPRPARGRQEVADGIFRFFGPKSSVRLMLARVNGETGVVAVLRGRPYGVMTLMLKEGRIAAIYAVADPAKLKHVRVPLQPMSSNRPRRHRG
jgi:RNA polymerase sigma-70 factor (ECF subfamily)